MVDTSTNFPPKPPQYDHHIEGHFGEFGIGAKIQAFYMQSALTPNQLKYIHLLNEIPGSEKWPVRDLFQRDVDQARVTNEIKPHFENESSVKFFSAVTLTLLPLEESGNITNENPRAIRTRELIDEREYEVLSRGGNYRIRYPVDCPQYATLEWNSERTVLVCIDGQHRVSTLRRIYDEGQQRKVNDLEKWRVPVIVTSFKAAESTGKVPTVLEVVRQLFTNINTEAKTVSESRRILLRDDKPNEILTQEIVERAHRNDLLSIEDRDQSKMPLLCFNWRTSSTAEESSVEPQYSPQGLNSVVEIYELFSQHLLDENFSEYQKSWFESILHSDELLFEHINLKDTLPIERTNDFRKLVNEDFIPGVAYLFDNFTPYNNYIHDLRNFERLLLNQSNNEIAKHSFDELRYGLNEKLTISHVHIEKQIEDIEKKIVELKRKNLPRLIERAIGFRGVVSAFGELATYYYECTDEYKWLEFSELFTNELNRVYDGDWLDTDAKHSKQVNFLEHIAVDQDDRIINFKHGQISDALGCYIRLLVVAYGLKSSEFAFMLDYPEFFDACFESYSKKLLSGFRKHARTIVKNEHSDWSTTKINDEVKKRAARATDLRLQLFRESLCKIEPLLDELISDNQ